MGNLLQQLETFIVKGTRKKKKKMWKIPHLRGGGRTRAFSTAAQAQPHGHVVESV